MREDEILTRARQEVAERRMAEIEQRWGGSKRWMLPLVVFVLLGVFVAVPGSLPQKLLWSMGGVCNLRPSHSYFAGDIQLPLEARMIGIYGGFMVTVPLLLGLGRWGTRRLGNPVTIGVLVVMFGSMAFDGVNSTLMEMKLPHLYTTTNPIRLVTGLLSGIALAPFMVWLASIVLFPQAPRGNRPVVRSPWELALPIAVNTVFGVLIMREIPWLYYPLALLGVGGIVTSLAGAVLLAIVTLSNLDRRISHVRQLVAPASLALILTFVTLASIAALRWSTVGPVA